MQSPIKTLKGFFNRTKPRPTIVRYNVQRNFDAGALDRLKAGWTTSTQDIDALLQKSRKVMVARSREAAQNNGYAKRFLGLLKTNICGPDGFRFQAQTKSNKGRPDALLNDALEDAYKAYSRLGNFDVTGQMTRTEAEHLFIVTLATDGEVILRLIDGYQNNDRFAVQFIDSESLDVELNKKLSNGNYIKMGVELNQWRKPVAYWFIDTDSRAQSYSTGFGSKNYNRVDASEIIHCFLKMRVNQTRGVPWMHAALSEMNDLHGYKEAAIVNSRVSASKMMFVTTPSGNEYMPDEIAADGSRIRNIEPGIIEELPEGSTVQSFDPTYPHSQYDAFIKTTLRGMASALEVSYNSLAADLEGVNFSSIRAGVLEDREVWKTLQKWVSEHFCYLVYEQWLKRAFLQQSIKVKGQPLAPEREEKCKDVSFQGRRWDWVDPLKDMNANQVAHNMGTKSLTQIIRDMGRDPDEVWEEIQRENEKLTELGITIGSTSNATQASTTQGASDGQSTTDTTQEANNNQ